LSRKEEVCSGGDEGGSEEDCNEEGDSAAGDRGDVGCSGGDGDEESDGIMVVDVDKDEAVLVAMS